jgi:SAM-dependent methyltransferase
MLLSAESRVYGQVAADAHRLSPGLNTEKILNLARYLASTTGSPDAYNRVVATAFEASPGIESKVTAYEENRWFVYAVAEMMATLPRTGDSSGVQTRCRWVRRVVILNASTFIVEDELRTPRPPGFEIESILSKAAAKVSSRIANFTEPSGELLAEIQFPRKATYQIERTISGNESGGSILGTAPWENSPGSRFMQTLQVGGRTPESSAVQFESTASNGRWKLAATAGNKVFKLMLPPPSLEAGEISIVALDGKNLIGNRPFPSGILPHGPEGDRLLELWDSDYRKPEPAYWDIGRPADELQKIVSGGTVSRCRVVDMCCGSGTDAIYLASKGFDVTAIDVAPTALGLALEKGAKAGVSVNWVVADILAPPDVKPFDFVYDRGCYHVVRDQNLNAYTETLRKFSHPGTKFLLLASRRDDMVEGGHSGVTEEELRFDFLALFDLQWLREIRLESNRPGIGPPGWSAFLIRNTAP